MQRAMDINSDVGESFGNYSFGADAEVIPHLSSVNVACGFHAGDPVHMERTVTLAKENDVAVGVPLGSAGRERLRPAGDEDFRRRGALPHALPDRGAAPDRVSGGGPPSTTWSLTGRSTRC